MALLAAGWHYLDISDGQPGKPGPRIFLRVLSLVGLCELVTHTCQLIESHHHHQGCCTLKKSQAPLYPSVGFCLKKKKDFEKPTDSQNRSITHLIQQ